MRLLVPVLLVGVVVAFAAAATGSSSPEAVRSVSSVAWAPGPSILFTRADGTFVYESSGPRRLSPKSGGSVVWSPRGNLVAFDYDSNIAVVRRDGSGLNVIQKNVVWPHWSPDGRWIAFYFILREGPGIMRPDGSGVREVGILRSDAPTRMAWSPDSRQLVFGAQDKGNFVVPIDGSRVQRPLRACPEWGPRGELAYRSGERVTIVRPGGRRRMLRLPACPTWSPDGNAVAATGPRGPVIANVRTGRRWRAIVPATRSTDFENLRLAWSPDGSRLAFLWPSASGAVLRLYVVGRAGGRARRLA